MNVTEASPLCLLAGMGRNERSDAWLPPLCWQCMLYSGDGRMIEGLRAYCLFNDLGLWLGFSGAIPVIPRWLTLKVHSLKLKF